MWKWQQSWEGVVGGDPAISHMVSASIGESAACLVRVPTDVIKAKMQTDSANAASLTNTFKLVLNETNKGGGVGSKLTGGLYRGYGITIMREIPFAMIQFPIYEALKKYWTETIRDGIPVNPVQAAACGSFGGAIAAAATTPLDVIKTRLMLGADKDGKLYEGVFDVIQRTAREGGGGNKWMVFFSGIVSFCG